MRFTRGGARKELTPWFERHRDKNGQLSRKHGNTLIRTLRKRYGKNFALGCEDDDKFSDVPASLCATTTKKNWNGFAVKRLESEQAMPNGPSNGLRLHSTRCTLYGKPNRKGTATRLSALLVRC